MTQEQAFIKGWEDGARRIGLDYVANGITYDETKDPTSKVEVVTALRRAFRMGWYAGSIARDEAENWSSQWRNAG